MLRGPHLMLANVSGDNGTFRLAIGELLQQQRCVDRLAGMVVGPAERRFHRLHLFAPGLDLQRHAQRGQHLIQIALQRDVRTTQFIQLGRVDIDMDNAGVRREGIELAGYAVVKTRADGNQQIAGLHREVRGLGAVHTQHAEVDFAFAVGAAETFQRGDHGNAGLLRHGAQRGNGLRHPNAAADIEHWLARLRHQHARLFDMLR